MFYIMREAVKRLRVRFVLHRQSERLCFLETQPFYLCSTDIRIYYVQDISKSPTLRLLSNRRDHIEIVMSD